MFCVCGRELTSTSATPWMSCSIDLDGKVVSGICQHGVNFPNQYFISRNTYKEWVDHMKQVTPMKNQI